MKKRPHASEPPRPVLRYFSREDLERLASLREGFLALERRKKPVQEGEYWSDARDLELYDSTFGRRIGWKWEAVLADLVRGDRLARAEVVLDWGCGSGVAVRSWLAAGGARTARRVHLWDHSVRAREYAAARVREAFPDLEVSPELPSTSPDLVLLSHVLAELGPDEEERLIERVRGAGAALWVEPGNRSVSGRLGAVRARLIDVHEVLAPCPHQGACGALAGGRGTSWCHFFARPDGEVFTEGRWNEFGRELGIDLRALPYTFLALRRRGEGPTEDRPAHRLLGRPRLTRGRAQLDVCDESGVRVLDFLQRTDRTLFRELGDSSDTLRDFDADIEGTRITALRPRR